MNPQGQYDFILNPSQPKRPSMFGGGASSSMTRRILLIAGGAVALIMVMFVVGKLLGGSGDNTINNLIGLAETQQEVIRIAKAGTQNAAQTGNQTLAINTEVTVLTQQVALVNLLSKNGHKLTPKQLAFKQSSDTDTQLVTAQQNSTYDVVYAQIMQRELTGYMNEMKTTYDGTTSKTVRTMLASDYTQAAALLKQVPPASSLTDQ